VSAGDYTPRWASKRGGPKTIQGGGGGGGAEEWQRTTGGRREEQEKEKEEEGDRGERDEDGRRRCRRIKSEEPLTEVREQFWLVWVFLGR